MPQPGQREIRVVAPERFARMIDALEGDMRGLGDTRARWRLYADGLKLLRRQLIASQRRDWSRHVRDDAEPAAGYRHPVDPAAGPARDPVERPGF